MLGGVIGFLFRWQYWLIAGAVAAFVGGAYVKGRIDRAQSCRAESAISVIEGIRQHEKIKEKIRGLSDDSLRREYCRWVRDDRNACLRADIPIREGQDDTGNNGADSEPQ